MEYLNIITPCSRPQNLYKISESINIPSKKYRWIVVFDLDYLDDMTLIPDNCEYYFHKNNLSISGNSQRNFALDMIKRGHVYFNDDDTIIHPELWDNIKILDNDFINFTQLNKNGKVRLKGDIINVGSVDSHNFVVSNVIIGKTRWIINKYEADGYFAKECYSKSKNNLFIDKPLSIYNYLR